MKVFLSKGVKRYQPLIYDFCLKYLYKRINIDPKKLCTINRLDIKLATEFLDQVINQKMNPVKTLYYHYLNDIERGEFLNATEEIQKILKLYKFIKNKGFNGKIYVKKYKKQYIKTEYVLHKKKEFKIIKNQTKYQLVANIYPLVIALFLNFTNINSIQIHHNFISRHILPYNSTEIIKKRKNHYQLLIDNEDLRNLHFKIYSIYCSNKQNFGSGYYYQGFDEVHIIGRRPTEYRFKKYRFEKYLDKDKILLDIGSNLGFFTLYCAKYVKYVYGLEINKSLIDIGNRVRDYLKIKNCTFIHDAFEKFEPNRQYNIIISNATHNWVPLSKEEYISRLYRLSDKNGIILFEFNKVDKDKISKRNFYELIKNKFKILENGIIKDDKITPRPFYILLKLR